MQIAKQMLSAVCDAAILRVDRVAMVLIYGKRSFDLFSHEKSIVKKFNYIDLPIRYQPYSKKKEKFIKMFLK